MARMARVGVFLAGRCSRAPNERKVERPVRKVRDPSPTCSREFHLTDRMVNMLEKDTSH